MKTIGTIRRAYQLSIVDHHHDFIGEPFPARDLDDAIAIVLEKYFKRHSPGIGKNGDDAYLSIDIPGGHRVVYLLERTGIMAKDGETNGLPH